MNFKKWLSENILWVLVALVVVNFLIVYWGTVNLGIYGARDSLLGWNLLRKKALLQEQTTAADADALTSPGQHPGTVSSSNRGAKLQPSVLSHSARNPCYENHQ